MKCILNFIILLLFILPVHAQKQREAQELNLLPGKEYIQNINSMSSVTPVIGGEEIPAEISLSGKMMYKAIENRDSVYQVEISYVNLEMKITLMDYELKYSTENSDEKDNIAVLLKNMMNKSLLATVSKKGEVISIQNVESLFSDILASLPASIETQKDKLQESIVEVFGEKVIKKNIQSIFFVFPDAPVSKGDKWVVDDLSDGALPMKMKTVYELKKVTGKYYFISGISEIEATDKDAVINILEMSLKYKVSGNALSEIKVSKKDGRIIKSNITQTLEGKIQVKEGSSMFGNISFPVRMLNTITVAE